eukprot:5284783-Pleurochrysis_carterae.AAC.1
MSAPVLGVSLLASTQEREFGMSFAAFGRAMSAARLPLRDYLVFAASRGRAGNHLNSDGWRALAEALKENTSLTTLDLW